MTFKRGDLVSLNSGGATMTVEHADEKSVTCVWSDATGSYRESYHPDVLTKGATLEELLEQLDRPEKQSPQVNVNFKPGKG